MGTNIDFDARDFLKGADKLLGKMAADIGGPVREVALEVLRLSTFEVPHDKGLLQSSGHVEATADPQDFIVGYNKVYAARLHEHPEYRFQKGRKGKYLEDPIKNNLSTFREYMQKGINSILG